MGLFSLKNNVFYFAVVLRPKAGHSLLILEIF